MDQHGETEANNSRDSPSAADQREETAAAEGEYTSEESMGQREDGYKADESTDPLEDDDVVGCEEAEAPPSFAHPWSLLLAFAGCLGLHGCCGDTKPPPAAAAARLSLEEEAGGEKAATVRSSQDEEAGGEKAATANRPPPPPPQGFYMQEVITRVWAVVERTPRPPDHAREGSGGNGGAHH